MLFTPRLFALNNRAERETLRKPALIGQNVCIIARAAVGTAATAAPIMAGVWGYSTHSAHTGRYLPETIAQIPHSHGARLVKGLS